MRNVLVTGGAGFIGCNFVRYLLAKKSDVRIVNLDALTYAGSLANLHDLPDPDRHSFIQGDIRDEQLVMELFREHDIDTVVHFAAETHVDRSIYGPGIFVETNVLGTFTLLEAARRSWQEVKPTIPGVRFHHVSTDEVFGSLDHGDSAFTESTAYSPNSPYAASKAASDHLVRAYAHTYGLPVTITNCSNNYGPYQFPEKLIPMVILSALEGRPIPVYGDGQHVRDWLYIEDHCEAVLLVLEKGRIGETYNLGGNNQPSNLEIVEQICGILDEQVSDSPYAPHRALIRFVEDRPRHDRRYEMDTTKMAQEFGWQPRHGLDEGLEKTVAWYLEDRAWLAEVDDRPDYRQWLERHYLARGEAS